MALEILLGCACIFSLGHSHAHWFGLKSLHRREKTASREAKFIGERWIGMVWTTIAAGLIGGAFFLWLIARHLKRVQQRDTGIAY